MKEIAFVLPVRGGSGGAHSVVQEVDAMRSIGFDASIYVNNSNLAEFRKNYERFSWVNTENVKNFEGPKELSQLASKTKIMIATTNTSTHSIYEAIRRLESPPRAAYYVQDYEPFFYDVHSGEYLMALKSFSLFERCVYFAKSRWLRDTVARCHGHEVSAVVPSIDHSLYHPKSPPSFQAPLLVAMVRTGTPRRAPGRTLEILGRIAAGSFGSFQVVAFGATVEEIHALDLELPRNVKIVGHLSQPQVAILLKKASFFLDLSDYQAFGRTAAEAMACGCIVLAPLVGGASDFVSEGVNGFLADANNESDLEETLGTMLSLPSPEARSIRFAAVDTVAGFTPLRAAISELHALGLA
ncbi:glycosyltransferase family 1 protein [Roseococcus sp. SYP-B2431]|uniref:glycosyltransferase family 4 protein n=1 Tax=Roseococcus sp. SYP-B2431 TaxID=2496640 RepID=UPI00103E417A|nr:glycosyltransferase family 4 protein [Roseococcus sp. SYP-B2431]TCI00706.1 glycosyltransferase family 1 protein [Roseococcus sp. SYP-B2431]